jgi:5'-3' exonuclease, N-terminal resolvase-like domain
MIVHLVDGTYELFRHFYGLRRFTKGKGRPYGAVVGVLQTVLQMIENGDTYLGVATDHVIESFRNRLWADYRVKGFASRGSQDRKRPDVLRLRAAVGERLRVLHRLFDELEETFGGAYAGRFVRHEIARSMEAYLL